jgi:hypothetical protein
LLIVGALVMAVAMLALGLLTEMSPETKRHTLEGIHSLWSRSGSTA